MSGEDLQIFERRERGVHLLIVPLLAGDAEMLDQIAERDGLGNFDRPPDLVDIGNPAGLRCFRYGNNRIRTRAPPDIIRIHRSVQRPDAEG